MFWLVNFCRFFPVERQFLIRDLKNFWNVPKTCLFHWYYHLGLGHLYFLYARIKYSTIKMKMIASLIFLWELLPFLLLWAGSLKSNLKRSEKKRKVLKIDDRLANVMNTLLEWLGWNCHFIFQTTFHFMHSNVQLVKKS